MAAKLEYKYYSTNTAAKFALKSTVSIFRNFINTLSDKVEPDSQISKYLASVNYNLDAQRPKLGNNFIPPQEIVLGYKIKKGKKTNQSMYYVPIGKSIKSSLEIFNLTPERIKLALYLDEISLVNPIGIFVAIFSSYMLRCIQTLSKVYDDLWTGTEYFSD